MQADAAGEQIRTETRRRCEGLVEELDRYRRELTATRGRLSPEAAAAGVAALDAVAAAAKALAHASATK
jgi:hypothetical protein